MIFEIGYFLVALNLFLIYFITITIFGYIIFTIIDNDILNEKISLTLILKSFAIGLIFHMIILMILAALRIVNFFTAYLPFILIDVLFLIYLCIKNDIIKDKMNNFTKKSFIDYIKRNREYILIICFVFLLQLLLQLYFIDKAIGYPSKDPYHWFSHTWFLHENGYLNYVTEYTRPPGFILSFGVATSIIDDFYVFYYFFKYIPVFLFSINILVIFVISKKIFKKKRDIILVLIVLLSVNYIFYRYGMPIVSILSTTLGFLFLLFLDVSTLETIQSNQDSLIPYFKQKIIDKNIFFKGLIIAGIFMGHPLYGVFYLLLYIFYEICILITALIQDKENLKEKFNLIIKYSMVIILTCLYFFIFLIPYIICILSYADIGIDLILNYLRRYFPSIFAPKSLNNNYMLFMIGDILKVIGKFLIENPVNHAIEGFFKGFLFQLPVIFVFSDFYSRTYLFGIIFIIIGLFLNFTLHFNLNKKESNIINFIKITFVFTTLFLLITFYIGMIELDITQNLHEFFSEFQVRLFEIFSGFWAVIIILTLIYLLDNIKDWYLEKRKSMKRTREQKIRIFKIFEVCTLISLCGFLYISNYSRTNYNQYTEDERIEAILWVGNYFNENPLREPTNISLERLEFNGLYSLLTFLNLERIYYDFQNSSDYLIFKNHIDFSESEYIFVDKEILTKNFISNLLNDFEQLNDENSRFIFAKISE